MTGVNDGLVAVAVESIDTALERLLDAGTLPSFDAVVGRVMSVVEDGTADFPQEDVKRIVAGVLATRMFRMLSSRIFKQGIFQDAD